ncbi:alanine racemase [Eggerthella sinensis]|uniref:alanine racemase n=3 Tax=Eggerthella TaxID=84111 RepID=UPI00266C9F98|nr:alanine racemase [Eggerthella sinensis]
MTEQHPELVRPAWAEIDLAAVEANARAAKRLIGDACSLMAVVKADAYGHGAVRCAQAALAAGARSLGVATVPEALELRRAGIDAPVLVLSEPPASAAGQLVAHRIVPSVHSPAFAAAYGRAAAAVGASAPFHLAVNTGMNRIGVACEDAVALAARLRALAPLELRGTFTHFATADAPDRTDFDLQLGRFGQVLRALRAAGIDPGIVHAAGSAAAIRYPEARFDLVRFGVGLYGFHPCAETRGLIDLRPAMSVHARVTDTRLLARGEGVSYGLRFRADAPTRVCTVPVGYADGLRRGLSGRTAFAVGGTRVPQVGSICMDQCMFDASGLPRPPRAGDEVLLVGRDGEAASTVEDMAAALGTIPHEVAIGLAQRLERVYR